MTRFSLSTVLLTCVVALLILGLVMTYSSSAIFADFQYHDSLFFFKRQLLYLVCGIVALMVGYKFDVLLYQKWVYYIFGITLVLLVLVLVPGISSSAGGASRWIGIGPFKLQAGEIFKFALVVFLATKIAQKGTEMKNFRTGILPNVALPGVGLILLMLEPDFGTTSLSSAIVFIMLFIGGARMTYLFGAVALVIPVGVYLITSSQYRLQRVLAFLDPWSHRQDIGYQVVESLITLGSGGIFGVGLGASKGKLFFLPAAHTDFILSVIGEELGFLGITFVAASFIVIGICGFRTAVLQKTPYETYLACGMTSILLLQAIINMFVVLGLVPTKGITLPFISYGGSSLLVSCLMAGILMQLASKVEKS